MTPSWRGPWARCSLGAGAVLLALAALLPVQTLVRSLEIRYRTVASFREDYVRGLQTVRIALAANGLLILGLPWLLARCRLVPAERPRVPGRVWRAAAGLYGIGLAFALPGLFGSFQDDEWRVLEQYVRHGPLVILTRAAGGDTHPLYSLLAWPFVAAAGVAEVPIRTPALLLTPLSAMFLFLFLRRFHPPREAWLAALPLAGAPFLLQYASEGRAYGPLVAAVLALALLHRGMVEGARAAWAAYVAAGVAAVFLHLYAAAAVLALGAAPLFRREGREGSAPARAAVATLAIGAVSFLLYSPTLPQYFAYSLKTTGTSAAAWTVASELLVPGVSAILGLPFLVAAALPAIARRWPGDPATAFLPCAALVATLAVVAGSDLSPRFFAPAYALAWIPVGAGLAAVLSRLRQGAVLWAALLLATAASDWTCTRLGKRDYRAAAREIQSRKAPGETLAVRFDGRPMTAYLPEPLVVGTDEEVMERAPDWHLAVDVNLKPVPKFEAWLRGRYEEVFRLSSLRGTLVGFRRR